MGAIQLPEALERAIEREVAAGRASSVGAFVEGAVRRAIQDVAGEEDELDRVIREGIAAADAGDFVPFATPEDRARLHAALMAEVDAALATDRVAAERAAAE